MLFSRLWDDVANKDLIIAEPKAYFHCYIMTVHLLNSVTPK